MSTGTAIERGCEQPETEHDARGAAGQGGEARRGVLGGLDLVVVDAEGGAGRHQDEPDDHDGEDDPEPGVGLLRPRSHRGDGRSSASSMVCHTYT